MALTGLPLIPTSLWFAAAVVSVGGAVFEKRLKDYWVWQAALVQVLLAVATYFIWADLGALGVGDTILWQRRWTWSAEAAKPVLVGLKFSVERLIILGVTCLPMAVLAILAKSESHVRRTLPFFSLIFFLAAFSGSAWLSFGMFAGAVMTSFFGLIYFARSGAERDTVVQWSVEMGAALFAFLLATAFTESQGLSKVLFFVGGLAAFGVFPFGGWSTHIKEAQFWRHLLMGRFAVALAAGLLISFEIGSLGSARELGVLSLVLTLLSFIRAYSLRRMSAAGFVWFGAVLGLWLSVVLSDERALWPSLLVAVFGGTVATLGFIQSVRLIKTGALGKILQLGSVYAALGFVGSPQFQALKPYLNWNEIEGNPLAIAAAVLICLCLVAGVAMSLRGLLMLARIEKPPVQNADGSVTEMVVDVPPGNDADETTEKFSFLEGAVFYVVALGAVIFGATRETGDVIQSLWTVLGALTIGLCLVWIFARNQNGGWNTTTSALEKLALKFSKIYLSPESSSRHAITGLGLVGHFLIETTRLGFEWIISRAFGGLAFSIEKGGEFFSRVTTGTLQEGSLVSARLARLTESGRVQWYVTFAVLMLVGVTVHFLIGFRV